jgi:hypothetical protein
MMIRYLRPGQNKGASGFFIAGQRQGMGRSLNITSRLRSVPEVHDVLGKFPGRSENSPPARNIPEPFRKFPIRSEHS